MHSEEGVVLNTPDLQNAHSLCMHHSLVCLDQQQSPFTLPFAADGTHQWVSPNTIMALYLLNPFTVASCIRCVISALKCVQDCER